MKIFFWIIVSVALLIGGYLVIQLFFSTGTQTVSREEGNANNVTEAEGKQYVEVRAKGGYAPRVSMVKAGIPTILRLRTEGTFDCSSQVRIPSLNVSQSLSPSGVTEVDLGILKPGTLQGACSMGMYSFEIRAEE
ncbi:MAG: cupredoxin domain-containing protein [Candidatus Moranbacteria bacterium]|jgi:plastocyanin domain-containing protein|nr:cupredoxin domain-containing protein [Candidatus Moranbacteria bacterium]